MNFKYGHISDKGMLRNFDNTVASKDFDQIRKLVLQDGQVVVRVLQGSEGKDGVQRQQSAARRSWRDPFVCGHVFGVSCTNQR